MASESRRARVVLLFVVAALFTSAVQASSRRRAVPDDDPPPAERLTYKDYMEMDPDDPRLQAMLAKLDPDDPRVKLFKRKHNLDDEPEEAQPVSGYQDDSVRVRPRTPAMCNVYPLHPEKISEEVDQLLDGGTKLIRYNLYIDRYKPKDDPIRDNFSTNYKLNKWQRVTSDQGNMLLMLAFNFDVLSLWLLKNDVKEVDVALIDSHYCMQFLNETERYLKVRDLVMTDFKLDERDIKPLTGEHAVCHQIIMVDEDGYANFTYECCGNDNHGNVVCHTDTQNKWINLMFNMFAAIKILVFLCGPMVVQRCLFTDPINKADYIVPLKAEDHLQKSMLVKKLHLGDDALEHSSPHQQREMKEFRKFRQLVKAIPSDEIVSVMFKKLHILIDHHKLMSEKRLPVGIFQYAYEKFLRCGMCKAEPFASCCKESIIGTWGPKFLWFKMLEKSECNTSCQRYLSWSKITHLLGYLLLLGILPLPYILRTICFHYHEKDEIEQRREALDNQNLTHDLTHNIFQFVSPSHGGLITMYIVYAASFLFLVAIRQCDSESCDDHIRGAIQDMRGISYLECFRMLAAHLVLPFEKFGICGLVAAALYWPFALPICAMIILCYCIPTLYLSGRFLLHGRPSCLQMCPTRSTNATRTQTTLSQGTTSFEACCFLNNINPTGPQVESPTRKPDNNSWCGISKQSLSAATYTFLVGILAILQMYSLLLMYAETVGFFVEGCMLVLLGSIINATITIRYLILTFWIVLYIVYCYKGVCGIYARLSQKLFEFIKNELHDDLHSCVTMRQGQHKNTAFKLLSSSQIRQKTRNAQIYVDSDVEIVRPKHPMMDLSDRFVDTINYEGGRLHWSVHGLVLFVDKEDTPRIPRALFRDICELDAPGCPGPIHKVLGRVIKQLSLIIIFLILMFVLLMILEEIAPISTTSELILTVTTGLLPLLVLYVLKTNDIILNKYSFSGKVQQVIMEYQETWPVYDLSFTREYSTNLTRASADDDITPPSQASTLPVRKIHDLPDFPTLSATHENIDPTHVDLLITIREESDPDYTLGNLRSEPGSLGSHGSLNSSHRPSPEDPLSGAVGGAIGGTSLNRPSNATISRGAEGATRRSPPVQNTPVNQLGSPKVDLVVDISKGGHINGGGTTTQVESGKNGIPMWPMSTQYTKVNEKEPEASL